MGVHFGRMIYLSWSIVSHPKVLRGGEGGGGYVCGFLAGSLKGGVNNGAFYERFLSHREFLLRPYLFFVLLRPYLFFVCG